MSSNKLSFKYWLAIFQKHSHHFAKVRIELIERSGLGVGSRESGNVAHIEARLGILFDNRRVFFHSRRYPYRRLILHCQHAVTPDPQLPFAAPADRPSSDDPDAKILAVINRHFSDNLRRGEIYPACLTTRRGEVRERAVTRRKPGGGKRRAQAYLNSKSSTASKRCEGKAKSWRSYRVLRPSGGEKGRLVPPPPRYAVRIIQARNIRTDVNAA